MESRAMLRPILLGLVALAMVCESAAAAAQPVRACDAKLNVADPDPAGLNVRAAPGGSVIGVLKASQDWVQVHVTGDAGGWARIDEATLYNDDLPTGEKRVFRGVGFVSINMLEIETLNAGAELFAAPDETARVVYTTPMSDTEAPKTKVLGCSGDYLQLQVGKIVGWTRGYCSNQRTTCS
jgi:hypothetical protein